MNFSTALLNIEVKKHQISYRETKNLDNEYRTECKIYSVLQSLLISVSESRYFYKELKKKKFGGNLFNE